MEARSFPSVFSELLCESWTISLTAGPRLSGNRNGTSLIKDFDNQSLCKSGPVIARGRLIYAMRVTLKTAKGARVLFLTLNLSESPALD